MTDEHVTRRRALKGLTGLAVAGSLAGCAGSDGSESTETTAERGSNDGPEATTTTTDTPADDGETEAETDSAGETETTGATSDESAARTVTFPSSTGEEVTATRWGEGDCAAVFLHGVGYDREDWTPQAAAVAENGHTALSLALNHDDRESNVEATVGAVDYLKSERGVETVVLVGASAGANAVVKTDANTDVDVAGSFVLAPGRAADLGAELSGRTFFAVGEGDSERFVETTKQLHSDAPGPKELVMLDSSEHAQGIFDTDAGDRLQSLIVEFVDTVCAEA